MVSKKKVFGPEQGVPMSFADPVVNAQNQAALAAAAKRGTGSETTTTKGADNQALEPSNIEGTFQDVKTGRPSGVSRGGRTFFISGSDLELFQQQQDAKDALSGGVVSSENPRNTIAQNQDIRNQQVIQAAGTPSLTGDLVGPGLLPTAGFEFAMRNGLSQEEIQRYGLTPLDMEVLQAGEAEINKFAEAVDKIPVLGRAGIPIPGLGKIKLSDFTGSSTSQKVDDLIKQLKANNELAELKLQLAIGNPALSRHYKGQIEELYQQNLRLESRIKLLSIQSSAIQGDPDKVIFLQTEIETSNERYAEVLRQLLPITGN